MNGKPDESRDLPDRNSSRATTTVPPGRSRSSRRSSTRARAWAGFCDSTRRPRNSGPHGDAHDRRRETPRRTLQHHRGPKHRSRLPKRLITRTFAGVARTGVADEGRGRALRDSADYRHSGTAVRRRRLRGVPPRRPPRQRERSPRAPVGRGTWAWNSRRCTRGPRS